MYIRCADCRAATWVQPPTPEASSTVVVCKACGRDYTLTNVLDLGSPTDQFGTAVIFAEQNGMDLPSAYSILLGIMTLEAARELPDGTRLVVPPRREGVPAEEARATPAVAPRPAISSREAPPEVDPTPRQRFLQPRQGAFDPAFRPAVEQNYLSPAHARQRGNREAFAARLVARHGMAQAMALAVADGRMEIGEAIARAQRRPVESKSEFRDAPPAAASHGRAVRFAVAAVMLTLVGLWLRGGADGEASPETRAPATRPALQELDQADVLADSRGRVIRVSAPDPRSVLAAYCRSAAPAGTLEPVRLAETLPPSAGTRYGLFRDLRRAGEVHAIQIRKERGAERWIAGQGQQPIAVVAAPQAMLAQAGAERAGPPR